jgi:hypothetical protein
MLTQTEFWNVADRVKASTEQVLATNFASLATAPAASLTRVLTQYRFFTKYYIRDLALLLSRLPGGRLRSFLGKVLAEELGEGVESRAHDRLYDDFLESIGVARDSLDSAADRHVIQVFEGLHHRIAHESPSFAIGLRGMGGECLCQVYLTQLHNQFSVNPWIQERSKSIDWTFWDIHTGEADIAHREQTKLMIDEFVGEHPGVAHQLVAGYQESIVTWEEFWRCTFAGQWQSHHSVRHDDSFARIPLLS